MLEQYDVEYRKVNHLSSLDGGLVGSRLIVIEFWLGKSKF